MAIRKLVQALTFNITGNTNAALFSAGPAVSATGVLDLHASRQCQWQWPRSR